MRPPGSPLHAVLCLVQALLVSALALGIPGGPTWVDALLLVLAALMVVAAPLLLWAGRAGRIALAIAALSHWLAGAALVVLVATSAGYLLGIYGSLGRTMGAAALLLAVVVAVVFWLVPGHQLSWLRRTREAR